MRELTKQQRDLVFGGQLKDEKPALVPPELLDYRPEVPSYSDSEGRHWDSRLDCLDEARERKSGDLLRVATDGAVGGGALAASSVGGPETPGGLAAGALGAVMGASGGLFDSRPYVPNSR